MSPFFALLLGHTIGDFVLQTIDLVRFKTDSWKGLFLHAAIVTGSSALCLWGNLPAWWPWLLPLLLLHVLTDWGKIALSRRFPHRKLSLFLLDQALHVGAILGIVLLRYGGWPYSSIADVVGGVHGLANRDALFLLACLIALFVVPLLEVQVAWRLLRPCPATCGNGLAASLPDRLWGGGERTIVLALLYIGGIAMWFTPLAFLPRILSLWQIWKQPDLARLYRIKIATSIGCMLVLGIALGLITARL